MCVEQKMDALSILRRVSRSEKEIAFIGLEFSKEKNRGHFSLKVETFGFSKEIVTDWVLQEKTNRNLLQSH